MYVRARERVEGFMFKMNKRIIEQYKKNMRNTGAVARCDARLGKNRKIIVRFLCNDSILKPRNNERVA